VPGAVGATVKKGIMVYHKAFFDATGHSILGRQGICRRRDRNDVIDSFDIAM
jgi:hypothetical protein